MTDHTPQEVEKDDQVQGSRPGKVVDGALDPQLLPPDRVAGEVANDMLDGAAVDELADNPDDN